MRYGDWFGGIWSPVNTTHEAVPFGWFEPRIRRNYTPDDNTGSGGAGARGATGGNDGDTGGAGDADDDSNDGDSDGDSGDADDADDADQVVSKRDYERVVQESIKRKNRLRELQRELEAVRKNQLSEDDIKAFRQWQQQQAEDETTAKKKRGEFESLLKEKDEKHQREVSELNGTVEKLQKQLADTHVQYKLATVVPQFVHPKIPVDDVIRLVRDDFRYDPEEGMVIVVDSDGDRRAGSGPDGYMTPEEYLQDFVTKRPHYAPADKPGGSGTTNQRGGKNRPYTPADIAGMSQADYRKNRERILQQADGRAG